MNKKLLCGLLPLLISMIACEPMIAIGKYEFLILILLIAVLLGPPLYKFARRIDGFLTRKKKDK